MRRHQIWAKGRSIVHSLLTLVNIHSAFISELNISFSKLSDLICKNTHSFMTDNHLFAKRHCPHNTQTCVTIYWYFRVRWYCIVSEDTFSDVLRHTLLHMWNMLSYTVHSYSVISSLTCAAIQAFGCTLKAPCGVGAGSAISFELRKLSAVNCL